MNIYLLANINNSSASSLFLFIGRKKFGKENEKEKEKEKEREKQIEQRMLKKDRRCLSGIKGRKKLNLKKIENIKKMK